jgi:NAD(P)H-nitrite reductase large subunit
MRYVIIGNSYAGVGAVEGIRELDEEGEITVISDEPYLAYARPLISYALCGRVPPRNMYYRRPSFYKNNKVKLILGRKAVQIDIARRRISLEDGEAIAYDKLLISAGGEPFVPPIKGIDAHNIFSFTKWDDAKRIRRCVRGKGRAVVYGGGLIGLKAAEGLNELGLGVTIVARRRMLAAVLDEVTGGMLERQLRNNGITLRTGRTVNEVLPDGKGDVRGIVLDNGRRLKCEILILAVGTRPKTELAEKAGIRINKGIMVDRRMMTSVSDIYAAGDVTEAYDALRNEDSVIAIVPLAYEQGRVAGCNMAGGHRLYSGGIGMNSITVYRLPIMSMGSANQVSDAREVRAFRNGKVYRKLVFEGNRLVGAVLVGEIDYAGILTRFIRARTDITQIKKELTEHVLRRGEFGPVLSKIADTPGTALAT